ncbi:tellurite resistance/C4-dicarboxylate transporter family protein [Sulfolobus acidocaldarius]|uniref:C4-dicarboxylate transporter/malic acid transport protein n=4 Tax=Sulfolobus acidocaldarius TaxID=2285 RepID=Q4J820_SULAC|nr:tellurite resistance/C4-dicarboxylate transporter family protein [Sulfolobus acidocaldarius]AAY81061.1 C4-dicarboxylate transporter/malic acid transport protein [Sulfolobus acidocaldarius DSM 639]AGE71668.1 C4-dicarboxylate transporter/malic acid transport protein [Sulfolobus acidocaldarius N8]AGE73941.1 C4-dicarboxylate transporter/malic acid transport protein [Sulfolobus acidocaldarius Ron12/I]ALU30119.1 C4-dicarboxylate transporter [Sulfolobus acidocaldarius]ALU30813.1 C4-dicarboxylate t
MQSFWSKLKIESSKLLPSYFASVMAIGIFSIAFFLYNYNVLSYLLSYLSNVIYFALWVITVIRWVYYPRSYLNELKDLGRSPGFLSKVIATNTIGSEYMLIFKDYSLAYAFFMFGLILWIFYQYAVLSAISFNINDRNIEYVNGIWELIPASTQSVVDLGSILSPFHTYLYTLSLILFFIGVAQYIVMTSLILGRIVLKGLKPKDASGSYWIITGAAALSALAGIDLLIYLNEVNLQSAYIGDLRTIVLTFIILLWSTGTWWIPWLIYMGIWKHVINRVPLLVYDPQFWGAVFPMGMYATSSFLLIRYVNLNIPMLIPDIFILVGSVALVYQTSLMLYNVVKKLVD